jgi:hypothetical protein
MFNDKVGGNIIICNQAPLSYQDAIPNKGIILKSYLRLYFNNKGPLNKRARYESLTYSYSLNLK